MKISWNWLQTLVDLAPDRTAPEQLATTLTMAGLALEGLESDGEDVILDLDIPSNRPDCLNHLGVARELAALLGGRLIKPDFSAPEGLKPAEAFPSSVTMEALDLCPRYCARIITGIQIGPSPAWLRDRLERVGQRSINNVVDITNYVLLEVGHPLHAFDYKRLAEHRIVVRKARAGEKLRTLDGELRTLDSSMLAICDAAEPVALAGIMGGADSEISETTETILLESAYFHPASIRATAKKLGMRTEASYRFERGADPEMPPLALNLACRLILQAAGGECVGSVIDEYPSPQPALRLKLRQERIERVTGSRIAPDRALQILSGLEFAVESESNGRFQVRVPSFRNDVTVEDDLVEEVARHYGYDRIPTTYPAPATAGRRLPSEESERRVLNTLAGCGFWEAYNYVFSTPAREAPYRSEPVEMIAISNPLSAADSHLRTMLLPGLVESLRHNLNYGNEDVRLFETGRVFLPGGLEPPEVRGQHASLPFREVGRLALVATGRFYEPYWNARGRERFQFNHIKGVIELLLERLWLPVEFRPTDSIPFLHPGLAAELVLEGAPLGLLGQIHPQLQERYKLLEKVFVAELDLDQLCGRPLPDPLYIPVPRFPAMLRDLSFVVDKRVQYVTMIAAIKALNIQELRDIQVIDLYDGPSLPADKWSLTVRLTFVDPAKTLTQEQVNGLGERVFSVLCSEFGAEGRS